jgi:hypothetical protein
MELKPTFEKSPDGQVIQILLTDEERISGLLTSEHLQEAIITLHRDGIYNIPYLFEFGSCN